MRSRWDHQRILLACRGTHFSSEVCKVILTLKASLKGITEESNRDGLNSTNDLSQRRENQIFHSSL